MPCSVKQVVDGPQGQAELEEHPGVVLGAVGRAGLGFAKALPQAVDLEGQHLVLALEVAEVGGAPHVRLGRHLLDADLLDGLCLHQLQQGGAHALFQVFGGRRASPHKKRLLCFGIIETGIVLYSTFTGIIDNIRFYDIMVLLILTFLLYYHSDNRLSRESPRKTG